MAFGGRRQRKFVRCGTLMTGQYGTVVHYVTTGCRKSTIRRPLDLVLSVPGLEERNNLNEGCKEWFKKERVTEAELMGRQTTGQFEMIRPSTRLGLC